MSRSSLDLTLCYIVDVVLIWKIISLLTFAVVVVGSYCSY